MQPSLSTIFLVKRTNLCTLFRFGIYILIVFFFCFVFLHFFLSVKRKKLHSTLKPSKETDHVRLTREIDGCTTQRTQTRRLWRFLLGANRIPFA